MGYFMLMKQSSSLHSNCTPQSAASLVSFCKIKYKKSQVLVKVCDQTAGLLSSGSQIQVTSLTFLPHRKTGYCTSLVLRGYSELSRGVQTFFKDDVKVPEGQQSLVTSFKNELISFMKDMFDRLKAKQSFTVYQFKQSKKHFLVPV